jgi:hypothetical protein
MAFKIHFDEVEEVVERATGYVYIENDVNVYIVPNDYFGEEIQLEDIKETQLFYASVLVIDKLSKEVVKSRFF